MGMIACCTSNSQSYRVRPSCTKCSCFCKPPYFLIFLFWGFNVALIVWGNTGRSVIYTPATAEMLVINVIFCVVCIKLSFFEHNCCDLAWPVEIQYIFFMLIAVQLAFDGPLNFFWVVFCARDIMGDGANPIAEECGVFSVIMAHVPSLG